MPTVLNIDGFRFEIFPKDHHPAHVHVRKGGQRAKIYLENLRVDKNVTFGRHEQLKALGIARQNHDLLWAAWRKLHG